MADVSISQEQFNEWQKLANKAQKLEAQKQARKSALKLLVQAHQEEYDRNYQRILDSF
jgi:chaperonin cofactor prefoldin